MYCTLSRTLFRLLDSDSGGDMLVYNISNFSPVKKAHHPRRTTFSARPSDIPTCNTCTHIGRKKISHNRIISHTNFLKIDTLKYTKIKL